MMEQYGENQIALSTAVTVSGQEMFDAMSRAGSQISSYLEKHPAVEHGIGVVTDVVSIVGFVALFVPGVGEGEMAAIGAARAGMALYKAQRFSAAAAKLTPLATTTLAGVGGILGGRVDGNFFLLKFTEGDDAADTFIHSDAANKASGIAALLTLPDATIGSIIALSEMKSIRAEIEAQRRVAQENQLLASRKAAKADRLQSQNGTSKNDLAKAARIAKRADQLAKLVAESRARAQTLQRELAHKLGAITVSMSGQGAAEGFYMMDNSENMTAVASPTSRYLLSLLQPNSKKTSVNDRMPQNLTFKIVPIVNQPNGQQ